MKNAFLWLATLGLGIVLFIACSDHGKVDQDTVDKDTELLPDIEKKYNEEETAALKIASDVTLVGQQTLTANLVKAIEDSGTAGAVVFCNIHVGGIYDSLKANYGATVSRVSHKNRNPANAANERELKLIEEYGSKPEVFALSLFDDGDHYTAYKPIHMSILACTKCHGEPGVDIEEATFITISMLYPDDKAIGFKYKDMRGLWKVEVPKTAL